jgi:SAM-dependent methyltransferase
MSEPSTSNESQDLRRSLDEIAHRYDPSDPSEEFDFYLKRLHLEVAGPWITGDHILEVGCATGELASLLRPLAKSYSIVEGSEANIEKTRERVPDARFHHCLWEEFAPSDRFSDIVCFNALEHAARPVQLLERMRAWLEVGGRLHVVVPNARSLHRLIGVEMGMIPTIDSLNESDRRIGHFRVYDIDTLRRDLFAGGFGIAHWQGLFLKMLSNRQMLEWNWDFIHALHIVGQRFPENCAELYVMAVQL